MNWCLTLFFGIIVALGRLIEMNFLANKSPFRPWLLMARAGSLSAGEMVITAPTSILAQWVFDFGRLRFRQLPVETKKRALTAAKSADIQWFRASFPGRPGQE